MSHMIQQRSTRDILIETGFTVLAQDPSATLSHIAETAQVGRATLHRHFTSRADLLRAMAFQAMDELDAAVDAATKDATRYIDALRLVMDAIVPLAPRQMFLDRIGVDQDPQVAKAYADSTTELATLIDQTRAEGTLPSDMPTTWIANVFEALTFAAWSAVDRQDLTPRQAADFAWRSFLSGTTGDAS